MTGCALDGRQVKFIREYIGCSDQNAVPTSALDTVDLRKVSRKHDLERLRTLEIGICRPHIKFGPW